jgi:hypothetical protein
MSKGRVGLRAVHAIPKDLNCATHEYAACAYTASELAKMDARFHARMIAAIERGTERCSVGISPAACTGIRSRTTEGMINRNVPY